MIMSLSNAQSYLEIDDDMYLMIIILGSLAIM